MLPCIMSPNIIANKKGKVTLSSNAGFASLYFGTPYVSTISYDTALNSVFMKKVGIVSSLSTSRYLIYT